MFDSNDQSEKKFLHDLASPLASAIFIMQNLKEELKAHPELAEHIKSMNEMDKALARATAILNERRNAIEK